MTSRRKVKKPGKGRDPRAAGRALAKKKGNGYMAKLAQRGGDAVRSKYGIDYFREISRRGVERRRLIREAGLKALGDKK